MIAAARELPASGFALEIDGQLKTLRPETGRWQVQRSWRRGFRCFGSASMKRRQRPAKKSGLCNLMGFMACERNRAVPLGRSAAWRRRVAGLGPGIGRKFLRM